MPLSCADSPSATEVLELVVWAPSGWPGWDPVGMGKVTGGFVLLLFVSLTCEESEPRGKGELTAFVHAQEGCHLSWCSEHCPNVSTTHGNPPAHCPPDPRCPGPGQQIRILLCYGHHLGHRSCLKPPSSERGPCTTGHGPPTSLCDSKSRAAWHLGGRTAGAELPPLLPCSSPGTKSTLITKANVPELQILQQLALL